MASESKDNACCTADESGVNGITGKTRKTETEKAHPTNKSKIPSNGNSRNDLEGGSGDTGLDTPDKTKDSDENKKAAEGAGRDVDGVQGEVETEELGDTDWYASGKSKEHEEETDDVDGMHLQGLDGGYVETKPELEVDNITLSIETSEVHYNGHEGNNIYKDWRKIIIKIENKTEYYLRAEEEDFYYRNANNIHFRGDSWTVAPHPKNGGFTLQTNICQEDVECKAKYEICGISDGSPCFLVIRVFSERKNSSSYACLAEFTKKDIIIGTKVQEGSGRNSKLKVAAESQEQSPTIAEFEVKLKVTHKRLNFEKEKSKGKAILGALKP